MMRALYKATQLCEGFLSIPRALTRKFTGEEGLTRRREGREGRGELLHFHAARRWLVPAIFLALLFTASGQDHPTGTVPPQAGDGDFIMGKITVNKQAGTVRFPATVNMADGALEYLLVSDKGKTHESLFATAVVPFQLQVPNFLRARLNSRATRSTFWSHGNRVPMRKLSVRRNGLATASPMPR
jgi:hypothetical protein